MQRDQTPPKATFAAIMIIDISIIGFLLGEQQRMLTSIPINFHEAIGLFSLLFTLAVRFRVRRRRFYQYNPPQAQIIKLHYTRIALTIARKS
jgi:hypothetical protein